MIGMTRTAKAASGERFARESPLICSMWLRNSLRSNSLAKAITLISRDSLRANRFKEADNTIGRFILVVIDRLFRKKQAIAAVIIFTPRLPQWADATKMSHAPATQSDEVRRAPKQADVAKTFFTLCAAGRSYCALMPHIIPLFSRILQESNK